MNLHSKSLILLLLAITGLLVFPVSAVLPGGGTALVFQCDSLSSTACTANGAQVSVDGSVKGTITEGILEIPYESGYSTYLITKAGYYDKSGSIEAPAPGQTSDITITVALTEKPAGSGKGWLKVHANVADTSVSFNGNSQGTMSGTTEKSFEVATTGTQYTTFTISRNGYVTYQGTIARMPSDGETVDLYATLNPVTTTSTTATTVPTTSSAPIGGDMGWYAVHESVDGASVYFDSTYKGAISGGILTVPVYTTGTPYTTYRVEKSGYLTASGSLPAAPAKGQTTGVWVSLVPVSSATTVPTTIVSPPGSGQGYIAIHCTVEGAKVTLDSTPVGFMHNGILTVPVSVTGTPYSAFTVTKEGYTTATGTVPRQPGAGETVDIYVTMNPSASTPVPTARSPVVLPVIIAGILGAVLVFATRRE
ncbi:hypothetical protein [uncultured Methanoregula sp.]|uniref:hypothetical protein n=1 Tax=uncultured Methanoregula sp. TaxID=1005933 RepID=UPI002AABA284|nr:hypothetical protein [uncultured Methanoregula sp.]